MLPSSSIVLLAAATAAATTALRPRQDPPQEPLPPFTCIPPVCGRNSSIICQEGEQYCSPVTKPDAPGNYKYELYRTCGNDTFSPEYPITESCEPPKLEPFDESKIPGECAHWMCAHLDGFDESLWCLWRPPGWTGMTYKKLLMECENETGGN